MGLGALRGRRAGLVELEIMDKVKCEASAERRSWLSWDVQEVWEVRPDIVLKVG